MDLEHVPPPVLWYLLDADRIGIAAWIFFYNHLEYIEKAIKRIAKEKYKRYEKKKKKRKKLIYYSKQ
jgi:hypothetical protein